MSILTLLLALALHAEPVRPAKPAPITVHVVNGTLNTVNVYVAREGAEPVLVGSVRALHDSWAVLPPDVFPGFSVVRLVAVDNTHAVATDPQVVHPGGYLEWKLGSDPRSLLTITQ